MKDDKYFSTMMPNVYKAYNSLQKYSHPLSFSTCCDLTIASLITDSLIDALLAHV